jgi:hypothetical protein
VKIVYRDLETIVHNEQALLVAVSNSYDDGHYDLVLAAVGGMARSILEEHEPRVESVIGEEDWRWVREQRAGLYVWVGAIHERPINNWQAFLTWHGSWRPALLNDFVRFGLPVPLPRLPEGVLHG